jgi:hypothetical protein
MFGAWAHGNVVGVARGDVRRMAGVFLIHRAEMRKSFRHKLVSDRPGCLAFVCGLALRWPRRSFAKLLAYPSSDAAR